MKKILAMILALTLVFSMGITVFADTDTLNAAGDKSKDVTVTITGSAKVYHVVINWEDMAFSYTLGAWNVKEHKYDEGTWNDKEAVIKVENHSNAPVYLAAEIDQTNADAAVNEDVVTADVAVAKSELVSADAAEYRTQNSTISGEGYKAGDNTIITVTASGNPQIAGENLVVGTVKVTVSANAPAGNP